MVECFQWTDFGALFRYFLTFRFKSLISWSVKIALSVKYLPCKLEGCPQALVKMSGIFLFDFFLKKGFSA